MAKNNATTAAPSGTEPKKNDEAIPLHKRLAMGMNPKTGSGTGPKTPA